ncbi:MAG: glycosyltransferase [Paludibacter sp.]|nr:glycosyltransferase [Paludibacter sp.]
MYKVVILNRSLIQYRRIFFDLLKKELNKDDIELELIYGKGGNEKKAIKDEIDIDWATFVPNKTINIGKTDLTWQPCLKYVKNKDLVVVDSENKLLINYVLMFQRLFAKRKLAFWGHGRNLQDDPNSLKNRFKYLFIDKCDWWFGYTKGTKQFLKSKNFPEEKITVLQNTIDTKGLRNHYLQIKDVDSNKLKIELGIPENGFTAIYCGAMYPEKNFDFILETCYRLRREIADFNMIFIGSGTEAEKIAKVADDNKWIHYVGPKFGYDRVKYFKIAQIQLLPFYVGLGVVDSFALETPTISTSNPHHGPEIEYLENGVNGLISNDNLEDYYQTVIKSIRDKSYLKLIEGCKVSTEKLTVDAMVQNFKNGIISCLTS